MTAPVEVTKAPGKAIAARSAAPQVVPGRALAPAPRRFGDALRNEWLPRVAWTVGRTGKAGLFGLALLGGAALFLISTHLSVLSEVETLKGDLAAARGQPRPVGPEARKGGPAAALRSLPPRADLPAILRQLFSKAAAARLAVDTGKYEVHAEGSSGVVRFQISFPVTGSYQQIRTFIDSALVALPSLAISELTLDRKTISDPTIEAQLRMTVYAAPGPASEPASAVAEAKADPARAEPGRVVAPTQASSLFAARSWYVVPPAPLPPPPEEPPPPPPPTAPPFPYSLVGSYSPEGRPQVYFLSKGDTMIDAHVGDQLDGVYRFESASGGQLVFIYLPLNIRQTLSAGAP